MSLRFLAKFSTLAALLVVAAPVSAEEALKESDFQNEKPGVKVEWFGHNFLYAVSKSGVRMALDPFEQGVFKYPMPHRLQADIVLVSAETRDRAGSKEIFGQPQVFRSITSIGTNKANGIRFKGIKSFRDNAKGRKLGRNTIFQWKMDGVKFCNLGGIGHSLDSATVRQIGSVDVLFLPIGNKDIVEKDLWVAAEKLKAKWIVPIAYRTANSESFNLRELKELNLEGRQVLRATSNRFVFRKDELPKTPHVLILTSP